MRVRDVGEYSLIDRLAARLEERLGSPPAEIGIGDDAALWRPTPGWTSVLTTDTMVEGVHFTLGTTPWRDLGWKSLAVNVSDLAAMAAVPRVALVTLGLTGEEAVPDIDALYDGIADAAATYTVAVIGGDTVRAPQVQIGFALTGEAPSAAGTAQVLRRATAQVGDVLAITGWPGDAAGGLELLLRGDECISLLTTAHRRPEPRLAEARWLYEQGVRCATDSSDGVVREAELLATASGLGATIDAEHIPMSSSLRAAFPERAVELALFGGEDYELVLALEAATYPALHAAWSARFQTPLTAIGSFGPWYGTGRHVQVLNYTGRNAEFLHFPGRPS